MRAGKVGAGQVAAERGRSVPRRRRSSRRKRAGSARPKRCTARRSLAHRGATPAGAAPSTASGRAALTSSVTWQRPADATGRYAMARGCRLTVRRPARPSERQESLFCWREALRFDVLVGVPRQHRGRSRAALNTLALHRSPVSGRGRNMAVQLRAGPPRCALVQRCGRGGDLKRRTWSLCARAVAAPARSRSAARIAASGGSDSRA
jgi:hypothetical protein